METVLGLEERGAQPPGCSAPGPRGLKSIRKRSLPRREHRCRASLRLAPGQSAGREGAGRWLEASKSKGSCMCPARLPSNWAGDAKKASRSEEERRGGPGAQRPAGEGRPPDTRLAERPEPSGPHPAGLAGPSASPAAPAPAHLAARNSFQDHLSNARASGSSLPSQHGVQIHVIQSSRLLRLRSARPCLGRASPWWSWPSGGALLTYHVCVRESQVRGGATRRGREERLEVGVGVAGRAGLRSCDAGGSASVTGAAGRHELAGAGGRSQGFREATHGIHSLLATCHWALENASYSGICLYGYWCLELVNRPRDTKGVLPHVLVESPVFHHQLHHSDRPVLCWDSQESRRSLHYRRAVSNYIGRIQHVL